MPICPKCEYEYIEGVSVCPDCGYELVNEKEFKEHLINPEDWEIIYTCSEEYKAEMIKANLEGAGIQSQIVSQNDRNFPAIGDFSIVKLLVKKDDIESAKMIIQDIDSSKSNEETEE
ncbi:MAG: DUF2007 domain-containing protein [Ignavibacteriales bacterium]|nr:DUF2007 domain-containing protein [Ignavibacteriales bacterium]